jgi:hypothetical protein
MAGILNKVDRFILFNGTGKRAANFETRIADNQLTNREAAEYDFNISVEREVIMDCRQQDIFTHSIDSNFVNLTLTYPSVDVQTCARWTAFVLGAAASPTVSQGKQLHKFTRSTNNQLPSTGFIYGFDRDGGRAQKFHGAVVNSVTYNLERRGNLSLVVNLVASNDFNNLAGFTAPDCKNLVPIKARDCLVTLNNIGVTANLWDFSFTISNEIPTGDDAFPFNAIHPNTFERGLQPTYTGNFTVLGSLTDPLETQAKLGSAGNLTFQLNPTASDHLKVILPNCYYFLDETPLGFIGELNRTSLNVQLVGQYDSTFKSPIRSEALLSQTAAFLSV